MTSFVANFTQKKLGWIPEALACLGFGTFISFCLVGYGSILYIWLTTDPGCVCYSQRIYMSRGRFESMREVLETIVYCFIPLSSLILFKVSRITSRHLQKSVFVSALIAFASFLAMRAVWHEDIPANYYLFIIVSKIMAYYNAEFGARVIQPMFTWSFLAALAIFFVCLSFVGIKSALQKGKNSPHKESPA